MGFVEVPQDVRAEPEAAMARWKRPWDMGEDIRWVTVTAPAL